MNLAESISAAKGFLQGMTNGQPCQLYRPNDTQSCNNGPIVWADTNIAVQDIGNNRFIAHDAGTIKQALAGSSLTREDIRQGVKICYTNGRVTVEPNHTLQKDNSALQEKIELKPEIPAEDNTDRRHQKSSDDDKDKGPLNGAKPLLLNVVFDGYDFGLLINYFDGLSGVMHRFKGTYIYQKDNPLYRYWRVRKQTIEQQRGDLYADLMECAGDGFYEPSEDFFAKLDAAQLKPDVGAFTTGLKERIYSIQEGGIAISGTYHPKVVAIVKNMDGTYLSSMKAWKLNNVSPAMLKNNLLTEMFLQDDQIEIIEGVYSIVEDALFKAAHEETAHINTGNNAKGEASITDEDELGEDDVFLAVMSPLNQSGITRSQVDGLLQEYDLYDYQPDGVWHLVSQTSALLADDMGLGKSRQAAVAAHILYFLLEPEFNPLSRKILVVCPAFLIINWTREIAMIDPDARVATQQWDESAKWIVTNYEQMDKVISYADRFLVMIVDEAHFLKDVTTARTRIGFDIAAKVPHRYLLTGTPILNRERELHTLLRLSGHPIGNIPLRQFENEFAGNPAFRKELNNRISEWKLRRMKENVLKTLKGKQRQEYFVSVSDQQRAEYELIANDASLQALPKITRLRQKLESIKIDVAFEMFLEMQADDKVLIFCEYRETVVELKKRFDEVGVKIVTIVGGDSPTKRQKAVDAFQENPDVRVSVGTTRAAGIGNNFTAANYVFFVSLPWTPALRDQAEDRAYRNGQTRLVIVKIPLIENTIDIDLMKMLNHKHKIAGDVLDIEEAEDAAMAEFALNHLNAA